MLKSEGCAKSSLSLDTEAGELVSVLMGELGSLLGRDGLDPHQVCERTGLDGMT